MKINSSEWYESIRSGVGLNMGIILEKSKLIFDELVGTSSFDDVFKNSIRDYYTYGFKSYEVKVLRTDGKFSVKFLEKNGTLKKEKKEEIRLF